MRSTWILVLIFPFLTASSAAQADLTRGDRELQVWSGGGYSVPGGTAHTGVFNAGLRFGWVLTDPHLPGPLRGRFAYAADAVPLFLVFQPANTAYGLGFDPLALRWNFERHGRWSPYFEICGGVLFTNHDVPAATDTVNFMDQAALGMRFAKARHSVSLELRYMHVSNAGLSAHNPGINTVQLRIGVGKILPVRTRH